MTCSSCGKQFDKLYGVSESSPFFCVSCFGMGPEYIIYVGGNEMQLLEDAYHSLSRRMSMTPFGPRWERVERAAGKEQP
jgi:hypothetical protein